MSTHLFIITGASRGMGLAMAQQLLAPNHHVLCISRHHNPSLQDQAQSHGHRLEQWAVDLADTQAAPALLTNWLAQMPLATLARAVLINNAGVIPPLTPLGASAPQDLSQALRVGLEAPMLLTAAFLKATDTMQAKRQVLNISSGLGRRAMASQSAYCAAKAGLDHFTRCLALDEARKPNGAAVCALAPGVIDTDMQTQLRNAPADDFPDQVNFAQLKTSGQLTSAETAAARVLAWLERPDFGQAPVADVRQ